MTVNTVDKPSPKILLVEGVGDERFVQYLRNFYTHLPEFTIHECEGFPGLIKEISLQFRVEGRTTSGIITDANEDIGRRWKIVCREVYKFAKDIKLPDIPESGGTIVKGKKRVGIWIMPDNQSEGELEDFLASMIRTEDVVWRLAKTYINSIPPECRRFKEYKTQKAQVYAWTAALKNPGGLLAAATREADLDVRSENSRMLVNWLEHLFSSEAVVDPSSSQR